MRPLRMDGRARMVLPLLIAMFVLVSTPSRGQPRRLAGPSPAPDWAVESNQASEFPVCTAFGNAAATAGDVDGDGFGDVIVGANGYNNPTIDEGRAFLYRGSASGLGRVAAWTAEGDQEDAALGMSAGSAGDVNGDSYPDVIIGVPGLSRGQLFEGAAFVYHGGPSGLQGSPDWIGQSNAEGATFGVTVAGAGDVNGDGYDDVIVGAPTFDQGFQFGKVYVYHGSASGLSRRPGWAIEDGVNDVGAAGDVNGDGFDDVIIGTHVYGEGGFDHGGTAYAYNGSPSGLGRAEDWRIEGDQDFASLGISVGAAGDVNTDGFDDVVVGASGYTSGQAYEGRAYVYHGTPSGLEPFPRWTAEGNQREANFGTSVGTADDVDRDGFADVIIGAHLYSHGQEGEGRVFLFRGSASGLLPTADWFAESNAPFPNWGVDAHSAGDVDANGFPDLIIGAPCYSRGQDNEGIAVAYYTRS
jgi:hypothetical protein